MAKGNSKSKIIALLRLLCRPVSTHRGNIMTFTTLDNCMLYVLCGKHIIPECEKGVFKIFISYISVKGANILKKGQLWQMKNSLKTKTFHSTYTSVAGSLCSVTHYRRKSNQLSVGIIACGDTCWICILWLVSMTTITVESYGILKVLNGRVGIKIVRMIYVRTSWKSNSLLYQDEASRVNTW